MTDIFIYTAITLQLLIFLLFFLLDCLCIIKNHLPLQHRKTKKCKVMNCITPINLAVLHLIILVVVTSLG